MKSSQQRTFVKSHGSLTLKEDVDCRFLALYLPAYIINILQKANIRFHELEFSAGVELFAFFDDSIGCFLRSSNNVDPRFGSIFRKCLQRIFSDPICAANKDGYKAIWKCGR